MPRRRHSSCAAARGWRVPTSPLALCSAATAVPGESRAVAHAARSTRPRASTGTGPNCPGSPAAAAACRPGSRIAECSTVAATSRAPVRRAAYRRPSSPRRKAVGPPGVKLSVSGATPRPCASTDLASSSSRRARRPSACRRRGSAQPASQAAAIVSRAARWTGPCAASRSARRECLKGGSVEGPNEGYATSRGYRHPCRDPSIPSR